MKTLEHWKSRFAATPSTIECPQMKLLPGLDHQPPIFVGPGQINLKNSTEFDFKLFASSPFGEGAFEKILRAHSQPYDPLNHFRLFATDYEGTEWACGTTIPRMESASENGGLLTGRITSLLTCVTAEWVSRESGVELIFQPGFNLPMDSPMLTVHSIGSEEIQRSWRSGKHTLTLMGSEIEFFQEPEGDVIWATANASEELPHLFLENWLSEPLRILYGQLIYPRMVARNLGNGSAHVSIRPSPRSFKNASIGSLLASELKPGRFWKLYAALLKAITTARGENGLPDFQPHRITRFYEEIIQASQGSRWVLCMTLASAAEGIAKLLMKPEDEASEFDESDIGGLKKAIQAWQGNSGLKDRALSEVSRLGKKGVGKYLRDLVKRNIVESKHADAWNAVRNKVMHGNLVSPWSTEEEDEQIIALGELVHILTRVLAGAND
jgi:hypothetical protein